MSLQLPQSVLQVGDGFSEGQSQVSDAGLRTDRPLAFESPLSQHLIQREVGLALYQVSCFRHQWETVIEGRWAAEAVVCPGCMGLRHG